MKTALVTGGGSGIGAACVQQLAQAGYRVAILDKDIAGARVIADGVDGLAIGVDLADLDGVDAVADEVLSDFGGVDVLVNNAGEQHLAPLDLYPVDQFSRLIRVMVEAPFRLCRKLLPSMYEQNWGRIVNMSSVRGERADPRKSAYVTAKHALEGLSKSIALEGSTRGVTSNCIQPAWVRTPLTMQIAGDMSRNEDISIDTALSTRMLAGAAIKELIEPEEIAAMVLHLCSPLGRHITGTSIAIDCGWSAS